MLFLLLLALVTFSIAGVAAFFSVIGLATMFTGAYWSVVIMGGVLEAGKLMAASFLYRYWHVLSFLIKIYLIAAVVILMVITSIGIYGKLSAAHQTDMLPLQEIQTKLELLTEEKTRLTDRKKEMDLQITQMPANYITARQRLMKSFAPELDKINARLELIQKEEYDLRNMEIQQQVHTGPIIFIAKAFDYPIENAMSYLIFAIMIAFDPLAVVLTLGLNIALVHRRKEKEIALNSPETVANEQSIDIHEHLDHQQLEQIIKQLHDLQPNSDLETIKQQLEQLQAAQQPVENPELDRLVRRQKLKSELRKSNGDKQPVAN